MTYLGILAVVVVLALIAFAAVEIGLRWRDGMPVPFLRRDPLPKAPGMTPFLRDNGALRYDRRLGWTLAPNMRAEIHGMTTDEFGNRMPSNQPRPLPRGSIVVTGNSFAAGSDMVDSDSWPAFLERKLGTPVVNASCGGWGADQAIQRAEEMLTVAAPKTLIVSLFGFDFQRAEFSTYHHARKAYYVFERDGLALKDYPVPTFNEVPGPWADRFYSLYLYQKEQRRKKGIEPDVYHRSSPEGSGVEITKRLMTQLKAASDRAGARLILLVQYAGSELRDRGEQFHEVIELIDHSRSIGIDAHDDWAQWRTLCADDHATFRSMFREFEDRSILGHWTVAGNEKISDSVADFIRPAG